MNYSSGCLQLYENILSHYHNKAVDWNYVVFIHWAGQIVGSFIIPFSQQI